MLWILVDRIEYVKHFDLNQYHAGTEMCVCGPLDICGYFSNSW